MIQGNLHSAVFWHFETHFSYLWNSSNQITSTSAFLGPHNFISLVARNEIHYEPTEMNDCTLQAVFISCSSSSFLILS